jgi:membrane-associated phospholipid phosphatase
MVNKRYMIKVGKILLIVWLFTLAIKQVVNEPRPKLTTFDGPGFPSQHTAIAFALVPIIGTNPLTLLCATLIGIERVITHNHTPIQVIAGALIGYILSYILLKYMER